MTSLAESNPPPLTYTWSRSGRYSEQWLEVVGPNLTVENVNTYNDGMYNCEVATGLCPPAVQSHSIIVRSIPKVCVNYTVDGIEDGSVELCCSTSGHPRAFLDGFIWDKDGVRISPSENHRFELNESLSDEDVEIRSMLRVKTSKHCILPTLASAIAGRGMKSDGRWLQSSWLNLENLFRPRPVRQLPLRL